MALPYTKQALLERIKKHLAGGFPGEDWTVTDTELLAYIDQAIPYVLKGQLFEGAKVSGVLDVPDAYLVNYELTVSSQNEATGEWYVTLPQPPLSLPTGYDITNVYVAGLRRGRGDNAFPVKNKRLGYRQFLPKPFGYSYRVEGQTLFLWASNNAPLYQEVVNVQLPVSRTGDVNAPLYLPDDALEAVFLNVVSKLKDRLQIPQDTVQDGLPAGNKTS